MLTPRHCILYDISTEATALVACVACFLERWIVKTYRVMVEKNPESGQYEGSVPGLPGARSEGRTLQELNANLRKVVDRLLRKSEPDTTPDFQFLNEMTLYRD